MGETMPKNPPQDKKRSPDLRPPKGYVRRRPGVAATPKSLHTIMQGKGLLQALKSAQHEQQDWLSWLRGMLPEELREAPINVIPKGSELVVLARSAAWSTRLRYGLTAIAVPLRERAPRISKVTVRVAPPER
jgi:hypothetical protein